MEKEVLNLILVEIREMKGDMSEVKKRLTNLEGRMTNLENDMSEMKNDMTEVKTRLTNVENDVSEVKNDMSEVKTRLKKVEELSEFNQETCQIIKNVVTSHYMEFKKHIKSNNTQHNLYNAKLLQYNKEN